MIMRRNTLCVRAIIVVFYKIQEVIIMIMILIRRDMQLIMLYKCRQFQKLTKCRISAQKNEEE